MKDSARARIPKVAELRNGELLPAMIQRLVVMQAQKKKSNQLFILLSTFN